MAELASWVKPARRPPVGVPSVGDDTAVSSNQPVGIVGSFIVALLAAWIVAEVRSTKAGAGSISVSGDIIGDDDLHLTYNQKGPSVDVTIS